MSIAPAQSIPPSFNKLYTLEGGIQNYMRTEGLDHWNGEPLFEPSKER